MCLPKTNFPRQIYEGHIFDFLIFIMEHHNVVPKGGTGSLYLTDIHENDVQFSKESNSQNVFGKMSS